MATTLEKQSSVTGSVLGGGISAASLAGSDGTGSAALTVRLIMQGKVSSTIVAILFIQRIIRSCWDLFKTFLPVHNRTAEMTWNVICLEFIWPCGKLWNVNHWSTSTNLGFVYNKYLNRNLWKWLVLIAKIIFASARHNSYYRWRFIEKGKMFSTSNNSKDSFTVTYCPGFQHSRYSSFSNYSFYDLFIANSPSFYWNNTETQTRE